MIRKACVPGVLLVAWASLVTAGPGLGGSWEGELEFFPDPYLVRTKLTLHYEYNGVVFSSSSLFTDVDGFAEQYFLGTGELGPLLLSAGIVFFPQDWTYGPYGLTWLDATFQLGGVNLTLSFDHFKFPYGFAPSDPPYGPQWPCTTREVYLLYTAVLSFPPISVHLEFDDCCTGTGFKSATLGLAGLDLCCGITFDAELSFQKSTGFDYVKLAFPDFLNLCCGITLDLAVTWTADSKVVEIRPKLEGLGEGCLTVYADVVSDPTFIGEIALYAWKLSCGFGDCSYFEFLHALDVGKVEEIEGDVFEGDEFAYLRFGVCGPGCCGGTYEVNGTLYFDNQGGLFGLGRVGLGAKVPVMRNFTAKINLIAGPSPALTIGWIVSF